MVEGGTLPDGGGAALRSPRHIRAWPPFRRRIRAWPHSRRRIRRQPPPRRLIRCGLPPGGRSGAKHLPDGGSGLRRAKLYGNDWRAQLVAFAARHPAVPVVDPRHAIDHLHNRISMLQVVSELDLAADQDTTFGIPSQVVVYDAAALADSRLLAALCFPLIAKSLVADGTAKSHKMSLVYHHEGLAKLRPPLVLLEFVNHGGVIFKVYVVGGHVTCVKRRSLPDVSPGDDASAQGSVSFSQVSNLPTERTAEEYYGQHVEKGDNHVVVK